MPIIELPDGNSLDIPDDAPPEVFAGVKAKLQGMGKFTAAQDVPKPAGFLESTARDLASGFGTAASLAPRAASYLMKAVPGGEPLSQGLNEVADSAESYWKGVGDKSTNNPWGQKAVRGVGGALSTGPASVVNAAAGSGAGIGDEVAERLAGGHPNPLLRAAGNLLGGFLGGTTAALATRARPQTADVAREAMEGLSPEQLNAAQQYKNTLAQRGIEIDLAQALQATSGHSGNLGSVRDFLAGRVQGDGVQRTLRGQPEQRSREAELTVGSLPGNNYSATQNATNLQEAATARLKQATGERSAAVKGLYEQAGDLPPNARNELGAIVNKYATQPGATEVMIARAKEFANKLLGNDPKLSQAVAEAQDAVQKATSASGRMAAQQQLAAANAALQGATGKPLRALDVDTWIGELRGPWQGQPLKVAYPKEQGQMKGLAGELNRKFQDLSPEVAKAEGVFKRITEDTINPLKQGPVGALSQQRGYDPATAAMVTKFDGLLNCGTDPTAKVSDIATAGKELAKVAPEAFEDAFKGWLSRKVQGATTASGGGSALPTTDPSKLAAQVFNDPLQWQGIKDATKTMAEVRGLPPAEVIRGLENLRQMTAAMESRPAAIGGMSPSDLKQMGSASNAANLVRVASFLPVNRVGEAIERITFGKTLSQLDTILTSSEGAKMLMELGKVPVMSRKAQVILGTWGGAMGNTPGLSNSNPPE